MNDDTDKPLNPVGDAALEARITAWVLGEASPFEAAELEEICARDPEARLFERRLRVLHGFISEDGKSGPDDKWKLPAEKRGKIEALFDEPVVLGEEDQEPEKVGIRYGRKPVERREAGRRALLALAACTVISAAGWMLFSSVGESSRDVVALQTEANVSAKRSIREEKERALEELRKAIIVQEDAVEDKRKLLSQVIRSENIVYRGDPSVSGGARGFTKADDAENAAKAYVETEQEKIQLASQIETLLKYDGEQLMSYASGLSLPDNVIPQLLPQYQEQKRQYEAMKSQGLSANHPKLQASEKLVEGMEKDLTEAVGNLRETLKAKLELSKEQLARLEQRANSKADDAVKQGMASQNFVDVKNDFETSQRLLEQLKVKLITEETQMRASEEGPALASADQVDLLPGGGSGGGSGGGVGMGSARGANADMAPAAPAQSMRGLADAPAEPAAPAIDSLAAVERKGGRGQEMDESLAKLGDEPAGRLSRSSVSEGPAKRSAAPAADSGAIALNDFADRDVLGKDLAFKSRKMEADVDARFGRSATGDSPMEPGLESNRIFASGGTVGEGQSRTNADFINEIAGVTIPGIPADPSADVSDVLTAGNRSGLGAVNRNSIDAILNNSDRKEADASSFGNKNFLGLEANGREVDIAGNAKSQDKIIRREMPMNSEAWSGRSSAATPLADGFDLQARFNGDVSSADAKVFRLGGVLHEDARESYAWSPNEGLKGSTEFSDLAEMGALATTSLGQSFDIQSRFRGEKGNASSGMALFYSDSAASGSEYDFGGGISKGYNLELDVARGALETDLADGFAANDGAPMESKELNQLVPAEQEPPADSEPVVEELAKKEQDVQAPVVVELVAETVTSAEPFSTFSLHVSDASFKLAKAALDRGEMPAADGIRAEEFYNAFDYGDPAPASGEPVVCAVEQSAHPALPQRNLLRIGVKTGSQGRGGSTPLNLTLLLDSSGSMEREDRNAGLANAVRQLSGLLKEGDTVSVIGFARQPRLLVDRLPGNRAQELNAIFAQTPSEGGTNLEEGLKLGEELALRQFNVAAQNRIVLFTDGAANLGDAKPETLQAKVEQMRQNGIAFDAAGFGTDGLNDKLLERLTRNGNGRYYVVDRAEDADANFAKQLAGAFRPAAENVKVQVRFNPARVAKYKLIGFEEHRLKKEDFRNDAVDAAEMAAEEAGNALYQIEALPQGEGEVGEVSVRFRDVASGQMVERTWTIPYEAQAPAFDQAAPSIQLAGLAAFAAEKLRGAPMADAVDFQQLAPVMAKVKARYAKSKPVAELESMLGKLK